MGIFADQERWEKPSWIYDGFKHRHLFNTTRVFQFGIQIFTSYRMFQCVRFALQFLSSNVGTDSNELFVSESLPAGLIQHPTHLALQQNIRSGRKKTIIRQKSKILAQENYYKIIVRKLLDLGLVEGSLNNVWKPFQTQRGIMCCQKQLYNGVENTPKHVPLYMYASLHNCL